MANLPWHWPIMKKVLHKHLLLFLLLGIMGSICTTLGISGLMFGDLHMQVIATIFALLPGLFILGFNLKSHYDSCMYYYEHALLKKYGKSVIATVTKKTIDRAVERNKTSNETNLDILSITYQFTYLRKPYEGESTIDLQILFNAIQIGMKVPILTMKDHHHITRLQSTKLKRQLNLTKQKPANNTIKKQAAVSQPLMNV